MLKDLRLYISPFFLSKYYLRRDLTDVISKYKISGSVVDIGCGTKPYRNLFRAVDEYRGIDYKNYSANKDFKEISPDYFFNKSYSSNFRLPFKSGQFENSVAFQVLEHHKNPAKLITEMFRIIKSGGYIVLSFPFLGGVHEAPNDYCRFTRYMLENFVRDNGGAIVHFKNQGSLFSVISMLVNEYLNEFAARGGRSYFLSIIIYPPFLIFQYVCLLLDKFFKSDKIYINSLVLIKKSRIS